jgi:hypothetical protein
VSDARACRWNSISKLFCPEYYNMSTRAETVKCFIEAFRTLDAEEFARLKTSDCKHYFAPASVGITEPKSNEDFTAHMQTLRGILKGFPVFIKELFDGEKHVTVWARSETQFLEKAMDDGLPREQWAFKGEYIFIFELTEDGKRISKIVEFLDSKATEDLRALMKRARKNLGLEEKHV